METTIPLVAQINPKSILDDDLDVGFIPMSHVPVSFSGHVKYETRKCAEVKKGFTHFSNGDVIFAKITPCFENSKSAIISDLPNSYGAGSTLYYVLRALLLPPSFLYYWVKSTPFLKSAEPRMTGSVGQKRLPKSFVEAYPLPLPPIKEQKRIVAKLDAIMPRIEAYLLPINIRLFSIDYWISFKTSIDSFFHRSILVFSFCIVLIAFLQNLA